MNPSMSVMPIGGADRVPVFVREGRAGGAGVRARVARAVTARGPRASGSTLILELLGQVTLATDVGDDLELRLEPVDRLFLVVQDVFEQLARPGFVLPEAELDRVVEAFDRDELELE